MDVNGYKTILSDLDGTLVAHNQGSDQIFYDWYTKFEADGFALIIASNNDKIRVDSFTKPFSIVGYAKCNKPGTRKIEQELFEKGLDPKTTVFLGDQIFTDMYCAAKLGIHKALVKPIGDSESLQLRLKRILEGILLRSWQK
jgi:HAD superfamily phosphatase (TIGR01668 family)